MGNQAQRPSDLEVENLRKERLAWERSAHQMAVRFHRTGHPLESAKALASFVELWLPCLEELSKLKPDSLKQLGFNMRKDFRNTPGDLLKALPGGLQYFLQNFHKAVLDMEMKEKADK